MVFFFFTSDNGRKYEPQYKRLWNLWKLFRHVMSKVANFPNEMANTNRSLMCYFFHFILLPFQIENKACAINIYEEATWKAFEKDLENRNNWSIMGASACCEHSKVTDSLDVNVNEAPSVIFKSTLYLIQTFICTVKIDKLFLARFSSPLRRWWKFQNENEKRFPWEKIHWTSNDYQENIIVSQIKFPLFIQLTMIEIIQLFSH